MKLLNNRISLSQVYQFLYPSSYKIICSIILLVISSLFITQRIATSKISWQLERGFPFTTIISTRSEGPCQSTANCETESINEIKIFSFAANLIFWYTATCLISMISKQKIMILVLLLVVLMLLAPRMYTLALATKGYLATEENCYDPSKEIQPILPMFIYEVKPYLVITDRGYMFPGSEYELLGEGHWYGMATLIWAGSNGAYFELIYSATDQNGVYSRPTCRLFLPLVDNR